MIALANPAKGKLWLSHSKVLRYSPASIAKYPIAAIVAGMGNLAREWLITMLRLNKRLN